MESHKDHSEIVNRILTGARWATMLRLGAQILVWLSTLVVIRFLKPEDYGLNSMLASPLVLMSLLSTLGLDAALVQAKAISKEEQQSIFGWLLVINGMLFLSYFFGSSLLAAYFDEPRLTLLGKAMAFIFIFTPFRVIPNALLDRDLDFKLRAQLEMSASVLAAMVSVIMAYFGAGVWALVTGILANRFLLTVLLMIFRPWFIIPRFNFATTRRMMTVGGIIMLSSVLVLLSDQLIVLVAGPILGAGLLGIYGMSAELASLPLAKLMPIINQTMLPAFAKFQEHRDSATYYLERVLAVTSLSFVPMLVGIASIADTLVLTLFGEKWVPSILPLVIMSLGMILRMTTLQLKTVMTAMGRADLPFKANLLQLALLLPLTIFVARHGVIVLMLAWVATEVVVMVATVHLGKGVSGLGFTKLLRCYRPALLSAMLMAGCVIGSKSLLGEPAGIGKLLLGITTGVVSYYLAARWLFYEEFRSAFKALFGRRFAFLIGNRP